MKTNTKIKKFIWSLVLGSFTLNLLPLNLLVTTNANSNVVYPLKKISKLECRFNEFKDLGSECIEDLPILNTKDYAKYASQNGWYNKFTRLYTVLWGSSYKYWWDVGYGWHMWTDIATAKWTPVYSIADWEVIQAGTKPAEWMYVSIRHNINWKEIVSNYMHLAAINVTKWDRVTAWQFIGEVGSTWNSTWNHLHLQIDVVTKFSPIYYDRATCPYSYYEITEKGVCFDELSKITVDPLLFLETNGAILNSTNTIEKVEPTRKTTSVVTNTVKTTTTTVTTSTTSWSIFDRAVNVWANAWDIREVQSIYKALWYYNWDIDWDYSKVSESIIKYQLDKNIILTREDDGAWNFWPKTRAQTKKDYEKYIASGWKPVTTLITSTNISNKTETKQEINNDLTIKEDSRVITNTKTEKISRENLMTREELEAKEVNEFLSEYNIDLKLDDNQIWIWETKDLNLTVSNRRGRPFKWSMPWEMTFQIENEAVSVFPERLFYFTDGKRDIKITWLKNGNIKLKVFIWKVNVKTFDLVIWKWWVVKSVKNNTSTKNVEIKKTETPKKVEDPKNPTSAQIISRTTYSWDTKNAIAVLKNWTTNFVNKKFDGTYKLKASFWNKICLKKGNYSDLENIYKSRCNSWFKNEIDFTYEDTVWWVLVFEYKALNKDLKFEVTTSDGKKLAEKNVAVIENNSLAKNYKYNEELAKAKEKWIISKDENFLENKSITEREAILIVKNTLQKMDSSNQTTRNKINKNISELTNLEKVTSDKQTLTRAEVLDMAKKYLIFEENNIITINFQDLDDKQNNLANAFFSQNETWKETNWNLFFKPTEKITKWEMVYLVVKTLKNANQSNVTLK